VVAGKPPRGVGLSSSLAVPQARDEIPVVHISPSQGSGSLRLGEVWTYRELLYFLVWRDAKVRYKQTAVGVLWALVQPITIMLLFSIIFGRLVEIPSEGIPYPLFIYAALLAWQLFAYALGQSGMSLVQDRDLVTKVYFPRVLIPTAGALTGLIEFGIGLIVLAAFMAYYGIVPGIAGLAFPVFILLAFVATLGLGLWLSALNVQYRDVQYAMPFLTQFLFFATPIAYPATIVPEPWRVLLGLNPMAGVVEGIRWSLFDTGENVGSVILISACSALVLLASGVVYFRRTEQTFADVI
jgi:lipopolysaccharide transport system permease protein